MAVKRRVAIAGLGSIGQRHARLLRERPGLQLEVVEPSAELVDSVLRDYPETRVHRDFEEMIASKPDVVWIASPTSFHAAQSIAALRAGAHVFCEKPMSDSPEDAAAVKQAADASGRIFNVGFVLRFAPPLIQLRKLIVNGELGRIVHLHARVGTYVTLLNSRSHYQTERPGSLFFDYSHQPDIFYWLSGLIPSEVSVFGITAGSLPYRSDPNVADIVYRYAGDLLATIHLNYVQMPECHDYEIVGDEGWARVSFPESRVVHGTHASGSSVVTEIPHLRDDIFRAQQQAFFDAIDGRCAPSSPARDGLIAASICAATFESWQRGVAVPVASYG
ncbi:MAG: Gfo/Idh/MocA family oxidoreductase [Bryobacterales bacterium]|nr:Gfo/Idh/MocA family oxidoreductase [Bryobacterales bacterium]